MRPAEQSREVSAKDLAIASLGLGAAAIFLIDQADGWAIGVFLVSIVLRLVSEIRGWRLPTKPLKLLILAAGGSMVMVDYGRLLGLEPGLAMVLILVSLKVLETTSGRDYQVVIILGYFLAVCDLIFVQDLAHSVMVGGIVLLLTAALLRFRRRSAFGRALWTTFGLTTQALPVVLALFLFFPRVTGGFRTPFNESYRNSTGISDHLEPGDVANLAVDRRVAFRASFPEGEVPAESELYWRGVVLWKCDGLTWNRGSVSEYYNRPPLDGRPIRQSIVMEPNSSPWLFALDRPQNAPPDSQIDVASCLRSLHPITQKHLYEVTSRPLNREEALDAELHDAALEVPPNLSPAVRTLAASWRAGRASDDQVVNRALTFFRKGNFKYSLTPGAYRNPDTALDEFLFQRHVGFCEHYAAAFATLMRVAGLPTRLVVGYLGGEVQLGYVEVSQADAHVWCEVWKKGLGWERIDPTSVIAPERITEGLESYLESQSANVGGSRMFDQFSGVRRILDGAHLFWANLTFRWDMYVLNFNSQQQRAFFSSVGLEKIRLSQAAVGVVLVVLTFLGALALWLARPRRVPRDPAVKWWDRLCANLAAGGAVRGPAEGPLDFTERAARQFPPDADAIREAGKIYAALRYGKTPPPLENFTRAVRALRRPRRTA